MALIELTTKHGPVLVEVNQGPGLAATAAGDGSAVVGKAESTLEDVLEAIGRVGTAAWEKLSKLEVETAEVSLGVKFSGKGKFFFAEVAGEAALTVKLSFRGSQYAETNERT